MRKGISKILITGGAGFMGSAFVRLLLRDPSHRGYNKVFKKRLCLIVVDKLTYAGDLERLKEVKQKFKFYKADICNKRQIEKIFSQEKPDAVVNFAAETHVDRSIQNASKFLETNIKGTQTLLDISRKYKIKKFIQISTDEIYGEIKKGRFSEDSPLKPNSPYAASKAAADLLIKSYIRTYDFPAIIIRPSNNYGPWQYPEKLIPLAILNALNNKKIPIYGKGDNIREWLYVDDCVQAIILIIEKGRSGEIYNIGSGQEKRNIEVIDKLIKILGKSKHLIEFVSDRPGHDLRYSLDSRKISDELNWRPKVNFKEGLRLTVTWYLEHKNWLLSKGRGL